MDTSKFKLWEDIKNDINGSFPQVLRTGTWTVKLQDESCQLFSKKRENLATEGLYHLKFNSKRNLAGLCRSIVLLMDNNGAVVNNISLLQYHNSSGEDVVNFEVKSHGTAKKDKPFFPSEKSVLHTMKEKVTKEPSRTVYEDVQHNAGGPIKADSIGQLPRSRQQVYNLTYLHKASTDPVDKLLKYAKETDEKVVISHNDFPEDLWILGTDQMCEDLGRFCTSDLLCYPLSVDPTFSFGKYEVTPFQLQTLICEVQKDTGTPNFYWLYSITSL